MVDILQRPVHALVARVVVGVVGLGEELQQVPDAPQHSLATARSQAALDVVVEHRGRLAHGDGGDDLLLLGSLALDAERHPSAAADVGEDVLALEVGLGLAHLRPVADDAVLAVALIADAQLPGDTRPVPVGDAAQVAFHRRRHVTRHYRASAGSHIGTAPNG